MPNKTTDVGWAPRAQQKTTDVGWAPRAQQIPAPRAQQFRLRPDNSASILSGTACPTYENHRCGLGAPCPTDSAAPQRLALIFLLLFAFSATASADVGWAPCAQQNEKQTVGHAAPNLQCAAASEQAEDTEQLIRQGQQALEAGQAEQAGLIFERILLEQPWRLGVWLDYALSLQRMGDNDSARAIYRDLLRKNPPDHLVAWLTQQIQTAPPPGADWQNAGAITLLAGHDSNLNRAPTASNLTLTLPAGALVVLPLADASRASAGASQILRLDWQAVRHGTADGDWLLQATLNTRRAPGISGQDYLQSGLGLAHSWIGASAREYHAVLAAQNLQYNGKDIQRTLRAGLYQGRHWQASAQTGCSTSYGAEWEMLAYPSVSELNSQYLGVAADLGCRQGLVWQLQLRAGIDQAEHQRPGGDQQRIVLRGQLGDRLGAGKWSALTELSRLRDTGGYSPLLDNNAARNIRHWLLKLEYQHPLGSKFYGVASAEAFRQHSNLSLFTLHGNAGWIGVRYLF